MVDRQDIDALLIGSLYGELSSTEEARLQAHLESHPADRTALHGLARTREAVRASRILQVQLEPPQSVSALLLQEAARRAPRPAAEAGWFQRFMRSFVAHPAMAAATMLVVVLGVAGTLYMRQGDKQLESGTTAAPVATVESAQQEPALARDQPTAAPGAPATATVADGKTGYGVGLAEGEKTDQGVDRQRISQGQADPAPTKELAKNEVVTPKRQAAPAAKPSVKGKLDDSYKPDKPDKPDADADAVAATRPSGPQRVLEVGTPQRVPLDIADDGTAQKAPEKPAEQTVTRSAPRRDTRADAPGGGAAPESKSASQPDTSKVARGSGAPPSTAPTTPSPAPPPPPPRAEPAPQVAKDRAADESRRETSTGASTELAAARDAHARIVAQVRAGKCPDAARTALALSLREPAYYEANVAHDRQLKDCVVYINAERDRAAERERAVRAKASKRLEANEPAKKSPAPSPPADKVDAKPADTSK